MKAKARQPHAEPPQGQENYTEELAPASIANQPKSVKPFNYVRSGPQKVEGFEPLVDADVAAEFLGITRRTLLQKVRHGKIPGHPLDVSAQKKDWRFKLSELDRFVTAQVNSWRSPPEP